MTVFPFLLSSFGCVFLSAYGRGIYSEGETLNDAFRTSLGLGDKDLEEQGKLICSGSEAVRFDGVDPLGMIAAGMKTSLFVES